MGCTSFSNYLRHSHLPLVVLFICLFHFEPLQIPSATNNQKVHAIVMVENLWLMTVQMWT